VTVPDELALVRRIAAACTAAGEAPPFSDQTLVDVRAGRAIVVNIPGSDGVAVVRNGELELAVAPEARGRGLGTALVERAVAPASAPDGGAVMPTLAWAHGDAPAARALADRYGWSVTRTLLQLRAPIPTDGARMSTDGAPMSAPGLRLDAFRAGVDETAWLDLNAAAFAHHPEQGSMTLEDLRDRESDAWFDPEDLLLLRPVEGTDAGLAGSCWLKVEDHIGEFYAVAVHPSRQGQGLGGLLMRAGMARLAGRGLRAAALYVEGDNAPALALYRRAGFTDHAVDVQYTAG